MRALTKVILITVINFVLADCISSQTTLHVPSQYPTIQSALNIAQFGDTILVQPGTYTENLIWPDVNGINLISAGDTTNTIIDGGELESVIYMQPFNESINQLTRIEGFKIINGDNPSGGGGGIFIKNSSPTLNMLVIANNHSQGGDGGGIYIDGSPIITNTIVRDNYVDYPGYGGGIFIEFGSPTIINVKLNNNDAKEGGGLYSTGSPTLKYMEVRNNWAFIGGGLKIGGENAILKNLIIEGNIAADNGGGVHLWCNALLDSIIIIKNIAYESGGGIFIGGAPTLSNVIIAKNLSFGQNITQGGGGIYAAGNFQSTNVFVCDNYSGNYGGGIYIGSGSITLSNLTISFNNSKFGSGICAWGFSNNIAEFQNITLTNNHGNYAFYIDDAIAEISFSNIAHNGFGLYNNTNLNIISAENNWWGDISGPYHPIQNPFGQGDSVNTYVDITPFLTSPDLDAPPLPIQNLEIQSTTINSVLFEWEQSPLSDVVGYKVHFDTTSSNILFSNTIDVGNVTEYELQNLQSDTEYYISVTCYDADGNESWFCKSIGVINGNPLFVEGENEINNYSLSYNYPNPFNSTTKIEYSVPQLSSVIIKVFDILGNEIAILVNEEKSIGNYEAEFDATGLPSGIYFYRLQAGSFVETKKMVLMK